VISAFMAFHVSFSSTYCLVVAVEAEEEKKIKVSLDAKSCFLCVLPFTDHAYLFNITDQI
jgi:hypothetical protein